MSAVLAKPQVKDFLKTLAKGKEKGQERRKEHDVNAHAATAEGEPSKKPWEEDIPELSSPSYSPPTSFSYSSDSSSSSNPRRLKLDHLAGLFVAQIFRLHGMPEAIVSDRDPRFTSLFWKAIWENIGTRLQFSSSFHPQTDGQSEIANSVVLDLLKSYISDQKTQWERYLPLVEFAYNNTIHSSTGKAPFEIVEGAMKVPSFFSTKDKIFEADEYTRDLDTAFAKVYNCTCCKQKQTRELYKKRSEYDTLRTCWKAALVYLGTTLVKLVCLATFLQVSENDTFDLSQESLKALIGFLDVFGLYIALTQLTYRNISQNHKFQAVGLCWAFADSLLHRLAPLWLGARGLEFTWDYLLQGLESNANLVFTISFAALGSLMWLRKNKPKFIVPLIYVAAVVLATMPSIVSYLRQGLGWDFSKVVAFELLASICLALLTWQCFNACQRPAAQ
ncbi:hypothetical protein L7F22_023285 [Adiantum nelumboides]|nr:hypothetical protein [Adiantum nelumboides]